MRVPSSRTRRDMELAAELRAAGATWETVGEQLGRRENVVMRWAAWYRAVWERMLAEAVRRRSRHADNESRAVLQLLLRDKDPKVKLGAADKLAKRRQAELAAEQPSDVRADLVALAESTEAMSADELEASIQEFLGTLRGSACGRETLALESGAGI